MEGSGRGETHLRTSNCVASSVESLPSYSSNVMAVYGCC